MIISTFKIPPFDVKILLKNTFFLDFKDQLYKDVLDFSQDLHTALVEAREIGPQSSKLENLIKSHNSGKFRSAKVFFKI